METRLDWTLVCAAADHVRKLGKVGVEGTDLAVYYLKVVEAEYQRKGMYGISARARAVRTRIELDKSVEPLYKELRAIWHQQANDRKELTPTSNTGVKSLISCEAGDLVSYDK